MQIPPGPQRRSYAKAKVDVLQHLDGRLEVCYQGERLAIFDPANQTPVRVKKFQPAPGQETPKAEYKAEKTHQTPLQQKTRKPAADHPWRRYGKSLQER